MRIKLFRTIVLASLAAAGCSQSNTFTLSGRLTGSVGDTLILEEVTRNSREIRESLVTDPEGNFSHSDTASNPRLFFIRTPENEYITLMVLGGDQVNIRADKGRISETLEVTGSVQTGLVMELNAQARSAMQKLDTLGMQYDDLTSRGSNPDAGIRIQEQYQELLEDQRDFIRSFIEKNASAPASLMALSHQVGRQSVLDPRKDFDLFERVDEELYARYPESGLVINLHEYIVSMKPEVEAAREIDKKTGEGRTAPEINLPDPEGRSIALSSLRGKYVLLDFWAAWCAPCRQENPHLVEAYRKFRDKGFEIYQVSLDKTREEWIGAIEKDGLDWTHVSDLQFWSSAAAKEYGVQSIPANFLLDPEGKIIARNLRGASLDAKLAELLR